MDKVFFKSELKNARNKKPVLLKTGFYYFAMIVITGGLILPISGNTFVKILIGYSFYFLPQGVVKTRNRKAWVGRV